MPAVSPRRQVAGAAGGLDVKDQRLLRGATNSSRRLSSDGLRPSTSSDSFDAGYVVEVQLEIVIDIRGDECVHGRRPCGLMARRVCRMCGTVTNLRTAGLAALIEISPGWIVQRRMQRRGLRRSAA